jgi:hypothetical protein
MYLRLCLALLLICGSLGLLGLETQTAHAEKHWFYTENGYGCEMTTSGELAKGVCRELAHPEASWYVVYIEFNADLDRLRSSSTPTRLRPLPVRDHVRGTPAEV